MYVNITVKTIGMSVTSNSCSGVRRIFTSPRYAIVNDWRTVAARPEPPTPGVG